MTSSNDSSYSNDQDRVVDPSSSSFLKDSVGDTSALDPYTVDDRFLDEPESQGTKSVTDASRELWGDSEGGSRASGFDIFNLIDEQFGGPPEIIRSEPTDDTDRNLRSESSGRPREIDDLSPFDEVRDEPRADGEKDEDDDRSDRPRGKRRRRRRGGKNRRGSRDGASTSPEGRGSDSSSRDLSDRDSIDRPQRSDDDHADNDHLLDAAADSVSSDEKSEGERSEKRGRGRRRRGGRGRRREGSRGDSDAPRDKDREPAMAASANGELNGEHDDEDHHIEHFHRDVTPWKEAINFIVNVNMESRAKSPNHERGRGGRGGKGGRPPRH